MSKTIGPFAATLFVFVSVFPLSPAHADAFNYELVLTAKLETGQLVDMPELPIDFFDCLRQKKKVQIGRKFPRGLAITADGNSPSGTIVGARCVQILPKMGQ